MLLTPTRRRIVELIVRGYSYREIGLDTKVRLSARTVRWHADRIAMTVSGGQRKPWQTRKLIRDNAEQLLVA